MGFVITPKVGFVIDQAIVFGGFALGMISKNPSQWYEIFFKLYLGLNLVLMPFAGLVTLVCKIFGKRIQDPPKPTQYLKEIFETTRCYWVVSLLAAWPVQRYLNGELTAYTMDLKESFVGDSIILNALFMVFFFLLVDFHTYWKHRLLHTRTFWYFHRNHHSFFDPSCFASFGVSPFESVLTFGPLLFDQLEIANQYKLCTWLHGSVIVFFIILNIYLHCGYTFDFIENTLPKLFINTSAHHNLHHSKTKIHFSELLTLWDYLMNTGATFYNKQEFQQKLEKEKS
ncbi:hypothetical protein ABPG74_001186 [Tetrahymena malaccensis]